MSIPTKKVQKESKSDHSVFKKQENSKSSLNKQNSSAQDILTLHQTIGNQAVQRLFESGFIQGKLTIGKPNDKYEQEADRVADDVMRMPEPQVQRQNEEDEEEEMIQPKSIGEQITPLMQRQVEPEEEEEETLQAKAEGQTPDVTPNLESRINALQGGGQSLSKETRNFFEPRFGRDFSNVKIHSDSNANQLARSINARAFTRGNDVVFGGGEYSPESSSGKRLLGHELTHVVQQNDRLTFFSTNTNYKSTIPSSQNRHIQREDGDEELIETEIPESTPGEIADDFKYAAHIYFNDAMSIELRNAAAVEGAAIGRKASTHMANRVRETCEPYERDQELDTNIMNTVFVVSSGAANVTRNVAGGRNETSSGGINLASRIVNIGLSLFQTWMPTLAHYRSVGDLKDAAIREMGGGAAQSGETTSRIYGDYENDVMDQLDESFEREVNVCSSHIERAEDSQEAQAMSTLGQVLFSMWRTKYLNKLRQEYGSRSSHATSMISRVERNLSSRLTRLSRHLEDVKTSRQRWQAAGAIGGGIAGGAALGAGIGALAGGVGAVPGAIIGGAIGGVVGIIGAISILWD